MKQLTCRQVLLVLAVRLIALWKGPVVNSHTRPCGHFTGCTKKKKKKKKKTVGGWKKQKNTDVRTAKRRKVKLALFSFLYAHDYRENSMKIQHSDHS